MSIIGVVENGKVILPPEMQLPDGTQVRVEPVPTEEQQQPLADAFKDYIGVFEDLPRDLARNHDHHFHGAPRE